MNWRYIGVQPYMMVDNEVYFILGQESKDRDAGTWSSFGGSPDAPVHNVEDAAREAARELDEESMGIFGSKQHLMEILRNTPYVIDGKAWTFLLQIDIRDPDQLFDVFENVYRHFQQCPAVDQCQGYLEKSALTSVNLTDIWNLNLRPTYRRGLSKLLKPFS